MPKGPAMDCLLNLPSEILFGIADVLAIPDRNANLDLRSLAHLALVSRMLHDIANPLLYKHAILWDWYMLCPGRSWMSVSIDPTNFVANGARRFLHDSRAISPPDYRRLFGPPMPKQLPTNRVGVLMTAAISGDLTLLSRLVAYIPHALRPLDPARVLSAAFYVPWRCPTKRHVDPEDGQPYATLLHAAAMRGDEDMARWLLKRRVSIDPSALLDCLCPSPYMDAICTTGMWSAGGGVEPTSLHLALAHGNEAVAKLLICKGAVWDRPHSSCGGLTGLHVMAAGRMAEMIEWTIDQCHGPLRDTIARNGPVHDWPDEVGCWSLHYVCLSKDGDGRSQEEEESRLWAAQMVSGLVRLGALVDTTDRAQIAQRVSDERKRIEKGPKPQWKFDNSADIEWAQRIGDWKYDENLRPKPAVFAIQRRKWRLAWNFIDAYPYTAAPTADVVSAFINDTIAPAAAARPQAASRAAASLLASVEGHGRQLHAQLRETPSVAAKDISAERGLATLQHRWGAHPWVPAAYAPRPPIAPLIIRKIVWITDKVLSRPGATTNDLAALWAGSPRDPENAGLLLRAVITSGASNLTKAVAAQAAKMLAAELAAADAEVARVQSLHEQAAEEWDWAELELLHQEEAAAQRMLALHEAEMEEAAAEAEIIGSMQDAEERHRQQQQQHEDEEEEEETEASRRHNQAFLEFDNDARDDEIPFFDNDIPFPDHDIPFLDDDEQHPRPSSRISHSPSAPASDDDPFRSSPAGLVARSALGAVRPRPDSDYESDAPPRQRRRISISSDRDSDSDSSNSEEPPPPPPARRVRRPRAPPANQEEEVDRIAQRVYDTTMSQLRQGTFTSRMRLAERQQIAWNARAAILDTVVAQEEGIAEPNHEPRAGRAFEDELDSEDDEELMSRPRERRAGAMFTSLISDSDDE
ncbi:ankyrin unc44 [Colletotrichum camelliae]|nr:ankyrin unc44 [Colletotrichum camelliae]